MLKNLISRLKKRKEFLLVRNKGGYRTSPYFIIQFYKNSEAPHMRVGYTATKKIGKAVVRNKCKRRLRALVHLYFKEHNFLNEKIDLVFIARKGLVDAKFSLVQEKFEETLSYILKKCL